MRKMRLKHYLFLFLLMSVLPVTAQPKYEVRAVWLTTLGGLDWPRSYAHDGMGITAQQEAFVRMLDQLQAINVNTILFQTRVRATTVYPSRYEPWEGSLSGQPGKSPGYDVLQFAIDECHRRGMEIHAWVCTIPIGKLKSYGYKELRRRHPALVMKIGEEGYMNPDKPQTADYLADICEEIVKGYDVDGIHLDYIRYPETWRGRMQASNITRIVRTIHQRVKQQKPWVKLSCSPVGKSGDLSRYSSRGWNATRRVAQDAQQWLRDGLMDQLYPMQYFAGNNFMPFAIDWQEQSCGRTIVSGLGTYMLSPAERDWPLEELQRQLSVTRSIGVGHCHFRAKFLLDDIKGIYDYMRHFDAHPALIPPATWLHAIAPTAPTRLVVNRQPSGDELLWGGAQDRSGAPYLLYNVYASKDGPVDIRRADQLMVTRLQDTRLVVPMTGWHYAVTAVDRYGNESPAASYSPSGYQSQPHAKRQAAHLLENDGHYLLIPDRNRFDARLVTVHDLQGRRVLSAFNEPFILIDRLPEGMYELRSLSKKGVQHRLGHFIVRRTWRK